MGVFSTIRYKAAAYLMGREANATNKFNQALFSYVNGLLLNIPANLQSYVKNGYQENPDIYTCINYKATKIGQTPFKVFTVKDEKEAKRYHKLTKDKGYLYDDVKFQKAMMLKEAAFEEVEGSDLNVILDRPNEMEGQQQFHEAFSSFLDITGNDFIYKLVPRSGFKAGLPTKVYHLPAQFVQIIGGGAARPVEAYKLIIGNQSIEFTWEEICHTKLFNPDYDWNGSELFGQAPLRCLVNDIGASNEGTRSMYKAFQNSGAVGLISSKDPNSIVSPDQFSHLQELLQTKIKGVENSRAILNTTALVEYTQIGMSPVDLAIIDSLKYSMERIARTLGLNPLIFSTDNASYNNMETAKRLVIGDAIVPRLNLIRDFWNNIASYYSAKDNVKYFIDYDVSALPEMAKDLTKLIAALKECWFITPNEMRKMISFDDLDNELMDKIYIPSNLVALDELSMNIDLPNNGDYVG